LVEKQAQVKYFDKIELFEKGKFLEELANSYYNFGFLKSQRKQIEQPTLDNPRDLQEEKSQKETN
jgi:hypothetical protein